jgi:hypothetical protein
MKKEFVVALQDTANNTAYITSLKAEKFQNATQTVTETMKPLSLEDKVWSIFRKQYVRKPTR